MTDKRRTFDDSFKLQVVKMITDHGVGRFHRFAGISIWSIRRFDAGSSSMSRSNWGKPGLVSR